MAQSATFEVEVYTTNPRISEERFLKVVSEKLLAIEMLLNEDMRFRFHIHEDTKQNRKTKRDTKNPKTALNKHGNAPSSSLR